MPAALHALIIACLVRIFGRLEHLVQQWQSGQLILPLPVTPAIRPAFPRQRVVYNRPNAQTASARWCLKVPTTTQHETWVWKQDEHQGKGLYRGGFRAPDAQGT